jgi:hypothetical protein
MVKIKFIIPLAIFMLMYTLTIGQSINLKVFNKTGYDIDSLTFEHFYLGMIGKDSTFHLAGLDEIKLQGDIPLNRPFGIIAGKNRPSNLKPCATKSKRKKSGSYAFDILIHETGNDYQLYWKKHD